MVVVNSLPADRPSTKLLQWIGALLIPNSSLIGADRNLEARKEADMFWRSWMNGSGKAPNALVVLALLLTAAAITAGSALAQPGHWKRLPTGYAGSTSESVGWDFMNADSTLKWGGGTHVTLLRGVADSAFILHWSNGSEARLTYIAPVTDTSSVGTVISRNVPYTSSIAELFCAGHSVMHDGRAMVVGGTLVNNNGQVGTIGTNVTAAFDAKTGQWSTLDSMTFERWYATSTTLGDGKVLALAGKKYEYMSSFGGQEASGEAQDLRHMTRNRFPTWDADGTSSGTRPSARQGHTMVYSSRLDAYVVFGGVRGGASEDTVASDSIFIATAAYQDDGTGISWSWQARLTLPDLSHGRPKGRAWHSAALIGVNADTLVIYGGLSYWLSGSRQPQSDVWMLPNVMSASPRWKRIPWRYIGSGSGPQSRYRHVAALDAFRMGEPEPVPRPSLIVHGGLTVGDALTTADVWQIELPRSGAVDSAFIYRLAPAGGSPGQREGHVAVWDDHRRACSGAITTRMLVHGGVRGDTLLGDAWALSRSDHDQTSTNWTWTQLPINGTPASKPRMRHAASFDRRFDHLRIFGGDTTAAGGLTNEHWMLPMVHCNEAVSWRLVGTGNTPTPRRGHAMVEDLRGVFANVPESYDPFTGAAGDWTTMTTAPKYLYWYPMMFSLRSGRVFFAGNGPAQPASHMSWVFERSYPQWRAAKSSGFIGGSAAMVFGSSADSSEFMKCGGIGNDPGDGPPMKTTKTAVVDSSTDSTVWVNRLDMTESRKYHNLTNLPDGNLLLTGGADRNTAGVEQPKQIPQLWLSQSRIWSPLHTNLAADPEKRLYHSGAILLPDGRVLTFTGEISGHEKPYPPATVYWPPYLFSGTRPVITSAPDTVSYCSEFTIGVTTGTGIDSVVIVRPGSVTHGFDMNQRHIVLKFSVLSSTSLEAQMTANAHLAPPGDYLLFVLENGVPSIAKWVRVRRDLTAPSAASDLAGEFVTTSSIHVTWTAPGDEGDCGRASAYDFRYSTSPIDEGNFYSSPQVVLGAPKLPGQGETFELSGLQSCKVYYFALATRDEVGNWSPITSTFSQTLCGGGGLLVGGSGEASSRASESFATARAPSPETHGLEPASAVSIERTSAPGDAWLIRALRPEEARTFGADTAGALLRLATRADGSIQWTRLAGSITGQIGVRHLRQPGTRLVALGGYSFDRASSGARSSGCERPPCWSTVTAAQHSARGDQLGAVRDSGGAVLLSPGDSLVLTYSPDTSAAGASDHFFVIQGWGSQAGASRAQRDRAPPLSFALHPNRPNPFARTTTLRFDLPRPERVVLEVLDVQGRRVVRLAEGRFAAGSHRLEWDGGFAKGRAAPGVYLYRLRAGGFEAQRKLVLLP